MEKTEHKYTNQLIEESSPYLLQHAHNPVDWHAWDDEALKKAQEEDKMLLVSIGYSACHWCHVMEKESFEDEEVAKYMNEHFVCIKVDREERPDVDQLYMNAVQMITGSGGWPLNCFALPDGRPFYGGTYFSKKNWLYLMQNVVREYETEREKVEQYADELTQGIKRGELFELKKNAVDYRGVLTSMIERWKQDFDPVHGGPNRAPKFPLPNGLEFLLDYGIITGDQEILNHVELTLDKMMLGGIFDQVGGGFARYSTDAEWHIPHFEKMLYDNAQLTSLYAKAFRHFKKYSYLNTMTQTLEFIEREMTGKDGEFYSALDADSEGEEGKYYVFSQEELEGAEVWQSEELRAYFQLNNKMKWEGNYVLHLNKTQEEIARELGDDKSLMEFHKRVTEAKGQLYAIRIKKERPGLDDKSLTSWNALMISGYTEAYKARNEYEYRNAALKCANLIWEKQHQGNGKLHHNYKKGNSSIDGFLEDYALTAKAYLDLYEVEFDPIWIERAELLVNYALDHFHNAENAMFYFTSNDQRDLVARNIDVLDNVIPSSNSVMANVLFRLGLLTDNEEWTELSQQMLKNLAERIPSYPSGFSNWAILMLHTTYKYYEVASVGEEFRSSLEKMWEEYRPNALYLGTKGQTELPLLKNKVVSGKTMIYVCVDKACQLPVEEPKKALDQISY